MTLIRINPHTLPPPDGDGAHVVVMPQGARFAFIAGQPALDGRGDPVGGRDLAAQTRQCLVNVRHCLVELKAGASQVAEMTAIVVDPGDGVRELIHGAGRQVFGDEWPPMAITVIGARALGREGSLVEVKATVALTGEPWVQERWF